MLGLFACMLMIHQNCETWQLWKNVIIFNIYIYTLSRGRWGQKKCTVCTLMKIMIIMDDPLIYSHKNNVSFCLSELMPKMGEEGCDLWPESRRKNVLDMCCYFIWNCCYRQNSGQIVCCDDIVFHIRWHIKMSML